MKRRKLTLCDHDQYILPRIQALVLTDGVHLGIRMNGLVSFSKLIPLLDKAALVEIILPTLENLLQRDRTPSVVVAILHCYAACTEIIGPEWTAVRILPFLMPMCIQSSIEKKEFVFLMKTIQKMLTLVETWRFEQFEHQQKLKDEMKPSNARLYFLFFPFLFSLPCFWFLTIVKQQPTLCNIRGSKRLLPLISRTRRRPRP